MSKPSVSVVMPVYNGLPFARESVESILSQTFHNFEFIIVDDGSTDGTRQMLNDFAAEDDRIHIIRQENRGCGDAMKTGVSQAEGKYIARMDADDVSLPRRFEQEVLFLESNPEIGVVGGQVNHVDSDGSFLGRYELPTSPELVGWYMLFECAVRHPTVMMRKSALENVGGYSPLRHSSDYDLWTRLLFDTKIKNLEETLVKHRKHPKRITSMYRDKQLENDTVCAYRLHRKLLGSHAQEEAAAVLRKMITNPLNRLIDSSTLSPKEIARLVLSLYRRYTNTFSLDNETREQIQRDAVERIGKLALVKMSTSRLKGCALLSLTTKVDPYWPFRPYWVRRLARKATTDGWLKFWHAL